MRTVTSDHENLFTSGIFLIQKALSRVYKDGGGGGLNIKTTNLHCVGIA